MIMPQEGYSAQSTPLRSNATSCITVNGDSDEDFQRTPAKQERSTVSEAFFLQYLCVFSLKVYLKYDSSFPKAAPKLSLQSIASLTRKQPYFESEWIVPHLKQERFSISSPDTYAFGEVYRNPSVVENQEVLIQGFQTSSPMKSSASR